MVSEVGFGGIPIQRLSDAEAAEVIRRCLDMGVTFIDTANAYGKSEGCVGQAIAGRREGLVLATKSGAREGVTFRAHLDQSLRKLGVAHIDVMQFHGVSNAADYERIMAPGGAMEAALRARDAGEIGHIGVSSHSLELAIALVKSGHFETMMFPFNCISTEPAQELIPLCRQTDTAFIVMKPMGGGMFETPGPAFKFLRQYPDTVAIPGIEAAREMEEILAVMAGPAEMTAAEQAQMARLQEELGSRYCRRCDYCQPCPQGIRISTFVNMASFWKRFPRDRFFSSMKETAEGAALCKECGACETRCPFSLPIREILKENVSLYRERLSRYEAGELLR
jgi:hypothetical protein